MKTMEIYVYLDENTIRDIKQIYSYYNLLNEFMYFQNKKYQKTCLICYHYLCFLYHKTITKHYQLINIITLFNIRKIYLFF
jgi:hypothetical protein